MEKTAYRVPLSVTISRKTGQVTKVEWMENATMEEFLPVLDWMEEASRMVMAARRQDVLMMDVKTLPVRTLSQDVLRAKMAGRPASEFDSRKDGDVVIDPRRRQHGLRSRAELLREIVLNSACKNRLGGRATQRGRRFAWTGSIPTARFNSAGPER